MVMFFFLMNNLMAPGHLENSVLELPLEPGLFLCSGL